MCIRKRPCPVFTPVLCILPAVTIHIRVGIIDGPVREPEPRGWIRQPCVTLGDRFTRRYACPCILAEGMRRKGHGGFSRCRLGESEEQGGGRGGWSGREGALMLVD